MRHHSVTIPIYAWSICGKTRYTNANQVALEAGNSSAFIFKHYCELVTGEAAEKWFSIMQP